MLVREIAEISFRKRFGKLSNGGWVCRIPEWRRKDNISSKIFVFFFFFFLAVRRHIQDT